MTYRIVYMGTPDFACPALESLATVDDVEIELVVTQPDRKAGRGRKLQAPPVRRLAVQFGFPVYQTPSLRTMDQRQPIVDAQPDLIVVAAFGLILGNSILELPRDGCVNLHASLLPKYRGASPIPAAILQGEEETGVTLMQMERGLDTGPMFDRASGPILHGDTTASLTERLSHLAAGLLLDNVPKIKEGRQTPVTQPEGASLTRPLVKADGWIDWSQPAKAIERLVRAMWSWPRAWTTLPDGVPFQIHQSHVRPGPIDGTPGELRAGRNGLEVRCGADWLHIDVGQLPGGNPATGTQLAMRATFADGVILGAQDPPETPGPLLVSL